jgi:hypothetical protein
MSVLASVYTSARMCVHLLAYASTLHHALASAWCVLVCVRAVRARVCVRECMALWVGEFVCTFVCVHVLVFVCVSLLSDAVGGGGGGGLAGPRPGPRDQPVIKVITVCAYTGLRFFVRHPSSSAATAEL